ncbi:unnamed protein product [Sphagnum compactum]
MTNGDDNGAGRQLRRIATMTALDDDYDGRRQQRRWTMTTTTSMDDGGGGAVARVTVVSLAPLVLGSKLAMNKKRTVHHAKGNSSSNGKAAANVTIKSLRA